jgi:two-component sensor histidine kinase
MKSNFKIFILLLVKINTLYGQTELHNKVFSKIQQSNSFLKSDHKKALEYAKSAFEYAQKLNAEDKITALANLINIFTEKGDFNAANSNLLLLKNIATAENSSVGLYKYYLYQATANISQGFFKDAQKVLDSAFSLSRVNNISDTAILIYTAAQIDVSTMQFNTAIKKFTIAQELAKGNIELVRLCKINQLPFLGSKGTFKNTLLSIDSILFNIEKENNYFMQGIAYSVIGNAYLFNFNLPLSEDNFKKANTFFEKINSPFYHGSNLIGWAQVLDMQKKTDSAILLNQKTIKDFEAIDYTFGLALAHMYSSSFYLRIKDTVKSKHHRELSTVYNAESKVKVIEANNMLQLANEFKNTAKSKSDSIVVRATKMLKKYVKDSSIFIHMPPQGDTLHNMTILKNLEHLSNEINLIKDSNTIKQNTKNLLEIETKYHVAEKNKTIQTKTTLSYWLMTCIALALIGIGFLLSYLLKRNRQNKKLIAEQNKVSNLLGILKHETVRQFGNIGKSFAKMRQAENPKLQVAKSLVEVNTYALLYKNLFISSKLAGLSLKESFETIFKFNCTHYESKQIPNFIVFGDSDLTFYKSDYLFHYMNELIANSLLHAFNGIQNPEIEITIIEEAKGIKIIYRDNGIGMPNAAMPITLTPGKGLYYIYAYATQNLGGSLETNFTGGLTYTLTLAKNG